MALDRGKPPRWHELQAQRGERGPRGDHGQQGEKGDPGPRASWIKHAAPYFASAAIAVWAWQSGEARDKRILAAQFEGRQIACENAVEDKQQDLKNVATQKEQYRDTVAYLANVKDPESDINVALKASLPNLREDIKQARAGIDRVQPYCSDPDLGLPR